MGPEQKPGRLDIYADLSGLPPLLMVVGGDEALLDDSVRFQRAAIAEVDVTLSVGANMQHVYPIYCGAMPEADAAVAMIGAWIRTRFTER